jgi:POT family proton-dependent oligopeptide transporter
VTLFWAAYEQIGNTVALWADGYTDRRLGLFGFVIPTTWFQAVNPFLIFAFTPLILMFWKRQAAAGSEPATVTKMAYGCFLNAAAYLVLFAAALRAGPDKASWLWLAGFFVVITVGELYLSPTGLSLVTKVAPAQCLSMMMGVWLGNIFIAGLLAGYLGSLWSGMEKSHFFLMLAAIAALAGLAVLAFVRPMRAALRG